MTLLRKSDGAIWLGPGEPEAIEFTAQKRRLLKMLADGHQNKTAALDMGVTIHAVGFHLRSIYGKLHVHSRAQALARALRDGLI